jgi:lipoprotein-anchoring transpeptidase ErfK/SrfK
MRIHLVALLILILCVALACSRKPSVETVKADAPQEAAPPSEKAVEAKLQEALAARQEVPKLALPKARKLAPGEFVWKPEISPSGPVLIVVSIPEQLAHVYRNGVQIAMSTVSTGRAGHATPDGVFTILEKQKEHYSNLYNNAPMPFMERVTWGGIALHAGNLPGYPASHGCIRLPLKFSELLYGVTSKGTT